MVTTPKYSLLTHTKIPTHILCSTFVVNASGVELTRVDSDRARILDVLEGSVDIGGRDLAAVLNVLDPNILVVADSNTAGVGEA